MKILLQTETGADLRQVEVPRMTPWPDVVTLGADTFKFHMATVVGISYRQCFAVNLDGFLPGGGMRDGRLERA